MQGVRASTGARRSVLRRAYRDAGPQAPPPRYDAVDAQALNQGVMGLFRRKMVAELGRDSQLEGYDAIIDLTRRLNAADRAPRETQVATRRILQSLFPAWLPRLFKTMFAVPFPAFSAKMNAVVTMLSCQWLMGPSTVNDVEVDGRVLRAQGVLVERCALHACTRQCRHCSCWRR